MKTELAVLLSFLLVSISSVFAQAKFQIAEVDQILNNPDQYQGKVIALHGVIDRVSVEQRTFTIVNLNRGSSAAGTNARSLIVTNRGGSQLAIPKIGQEVVVIGQIGSQDGVTNFMATQVFTNRDEVRQIVADGSIVRRNGKRPGDNLGRDAQPSNNLDR